MENNVFPYSYELPYSINVTLYKHNYIDNLLLSYIKNDAISNKLKGDTYVIDTQSLKGIITEKFNKELDEIENSSGSTDTITSVYFLNKILNDFINLRYIKINISDNKNYTRLIEQDGKKMINFNYVIANSMIELPKYVETDDQLNVLNTILKMANIFPTKFGKITQPYVMLTSNDFLNKLELIEESVVEFGDDFEKGLNLLYELVSQQNEYDNTKLIIITDFI